MERDVLKRVQAEQQKTTPEVQEQEKPFDLRMAGPLELQGVIGNKATANLLRGPGGTTIQTKMTVTDANDQYEKEADSVAEKIVSGNSQADVQRAAPEEDVMEQRLQREPAMEEEMPEAEASAEMEEADTMEVAPGEADPSPLPADSDDMEEEESVAMAKRIQRNVDDAAISDDDLQTHRVQRTAQDMSKSFDVGGDVEDQIRNTSGGQALDSGIQAKMESGTGHDFSNVRVHTDSNADALSESLGARAFTTGSDIFFKSGEYNPGTQDGDKLIAHESTHVIQQGGTQLKRDED